MKLARVITLCAAVFFLTGACNPEIAETKPEELLAFPGAEGHGRYVSGGRGGTVYYVTNLDDYLKDETPIPGSLRYGIETNSKTSPRIMILFKVSGTIILKRELRFNRGNITIAGQSAPGDGICVAGFRVVLNETDNIIIRYLRFRMGDLYDINGDGADAIWARNAKNIIIDHCSVSWSTDECASFYDNENFTMQWCIVSESLNESLHSKGAHGYGGIWGGFKASFHHNLLAHHQSRVPRLAGNADCNTDVRNNVYYNYNGNGCYGGDGTNVNIVNNYYIPGPAWNQGRAKKGRILATGKTVEGVLGTYFIDGNVVEGHAEASSDNWTFGVYNQIAVPPNEAEKTAMRLTEPLFTDTVTTHTAQEAFDQVLLYAGCSHRRDSVDERIFYETLMRSTEFMGKKPTAPMPGIIDSVMDLKPEGAGDDWLPWPALDPGTPVTDSNGDGIPDGWLEQHYPGKTAGDTNETGYTHLEVYLNSLVADITRLQNG